MEQTRKIIRITAALAVLVVAAAVYPLIAAGCYGSGDSPYALGEGQLTIYRNRILVGTDPTYPPFEYNRDGSIEGFDIDIASEIAARLDKDIEIIPITWDFSYKIPEDTRLDMIISAVSAHGDKDEFVDFSDPYYTLEYIFVVLSDTELKIKEDLKGRKVGMIDIRVKDIDPSYLESFTVEEYREVLLMMEDLRSGKIDAVLISLPVGKNIIEENEGIYRVLEVIRSSMMFNIVFHQGSPLREEVNRILAEMVQDGTYQQIHDRWFSLSSG